MMKKIAVFIAVLVVLVAVVLGYRQLKQEHLPPVKTIDAVPLNASGLLIIKNFHSFYKKTLSTNLFWEELMAIKPVKKLSTEIAQVDSVLQNNDEISDMFQPELVVSLHTSGAKKFDYIFTAQLNTPVDESRVKTYLEQLFRATVTSRQYENTAIYAIALSGEKLYCVAGKRFVSFSFSSILIEDVVRHWHSGQTLFSDKNFARVYQTLGAQSEFYVLLKPHSALQNMAVYFKRYFHRTGDYSDWTVFDGTLKPNAVELTGFSVAGDSANHYLSVFQNQAKQNLQSPEYLPKTTAFYYHIGFSDSKTYQKKYIQYLKGAKRGFKRDKHIDELNKYFQSSIEKEFLFRLVDEATFAIAQPPLGEEFKNSYVLAKCVDAEKVLLLLTQNSAASEKINNIDVFTLNTAIHFGLLLNPVFPEFKQASVFVIDDYLIFASNKRAAEEFIRQYRFRHTLANDESYRSLTNNISSESNSTVYFNIPQSENLILWALSNEAQQFFKTNKDVLNKYQAVIWQTAHVKNNLYYQYAYIKYNPAFKLSTASLWEVALDTAFTRAPQVVINHKTGLKEIVVQDVNNVLYLISPTGKILWKKSLPLPIKGKIYQIDRYKNGKLQLLFNTAEKLYLIDRNGNFVEPYPVKLPEKASGPLQVMDYDNNRKYRILVPCFDNMVYNYNADGNLVNGWLFEKQLSPVLKIYPHFAINGKDYLTFVNQEGKVLVTGRNGKQRIAITETVPFTAFVADYLSVASSIAKTSIIGVDTSGTLYRLYYNNTQQVSKRKTALTFADFGLVDNNKKPDIIFSDKNKVEVYTLDEAKIWSAELPQPVTYIHYIKAGQQKYIGAVAGNEIFLYDNEGNLLPDFPVKGNTPFAIDDLEKDGKYNLIIGDKNVLLNYQLQK